MSSLKAYKREVLKLSRLYGIKLHHNAVDVLQDAVSDMDMDEAKESLRNLLSKISQIRKRNRKIQTF
jgi:hypothetical protein